METVFTTSSVPGQAYLICKALEFTMKSLHLPDEMGGAEQNYVIPGAAPREVVSLLLLTSSWEGNG